MIIACFVFFESFAQDKIIPPSPEAYALSRYGDIPVALYTGVPQIAIPIYTLEENDIVVDISLSYHAGGHKVDEVASSVGLGWTLNAGGVITREVRHRADKITQQGQLTPQRPTIDFYHGNTYNQQQVYVQGLYVLASGQRDSEPDEFMYNFLGHSGKFYLDEGGEARLHSHEGMQVTLEYDGSNDGRFRVTTPDGMIYLFTNKEVSSFVDNNLSAVTSWYLTSITSPKGSVVSFEYQQKSVPIQNRLSIESTVNVSTSSPSISASNHIGNLSNASQLIIKKIISSNAVVDFLPSGTARLDVSGTEYPLESIRVSDGLGQQITKFQLTTGYFVANNSQQYAGTVPSSAPYLNYRLRLQAVQQFDAQNVAVLPPYQITYLGDDNPATADAYTLPHRLSASQDHWGYYNNKSNAHLFPGNPTGSEMPVDRSYLKFLGDSYMTGIFKVMSNGANRNVDTASVKAGMISTLKYPTGGYTAFQFESNSFTWLGSEYGCGVRVKQIAHFSSSGQLADKITYKYESGVINQHPKDYYYRYYYVDYLPNGSPAIPEVLVTFGLSNNPLSLAPYHDYVKIRALPQTLLRSSSEINYGKVTVERLGNGREENVFATTSVFPDYTRYETDYLDPADVDSLNQLFYSQYTSSIYNPSDPLGSENQYPSGITMGDFPYPPVYANEWKRGVLTNQFIYNASGVLLKRIDNQYTRKLLKTNEAWRVAEIGTSGTQYMTAKYYTGGGWMFLNQQKVTTYDADGNSISYENHFFRDNVKHAQVTRSKRLNSDGSTEVTHTTYPHDYSNTSGFIGEMKAKHLSGYPIEQVNYKEVGSTRTMLSGNITVYKTGGNGLVEQLLGLESMSPVALSSFKFSNRGTGVLPPTGSTGAYSPDSRYKPHLAYGNYTTRGHPLQVTPVGGPSTSYLWDYSGMYLAAAVQNAQPGQFAYTSFETLEKGGWSYSGAPTLSPTVSKTGRYYYNLGLGTVDKSGIGASAAKPYLLTFWVRRSSGSGNWTFMGKTESLTTAWMFISRLVTTGSVSISGSGLYIDEVQGNRI